MLLILMLAFSVFPSVLEQDLGGTVNNYMYLSRDYFGDFVYGSFTASGNYSVASISIKLKQGVPPPFPHSELMTNPVYLYIMTDNGSGLPLWSSAVAATNNHADSLPDNNTYLYYNFAFATNSFIVTNGVKYYVVAKRVADPSVYCDIGIQDCGSEHWGRGTDGSSWTQMAAGQLTMQIYGDPTPFIDSVNNGILSQCGKDTVRIRGNYFGATQSTGVLFFNTDTMKTILHWDDTLVRFVTIAEPVAQHNSLIVMSSEMVKDTIDVTVYPASCKKYKKCTIGIVR